MGLFRGFVTALWFSTCVCYCLAAIRYDQSQSGDYNIHIDLKNLEVVAILDDGSFVGEYDYDYDQLTEKPHPPHIDANSTYISPNFHLKPETANCSNTTTAVPKRNASEEFTNSTQSSAPDHEIRPSTETPLVPATAVSNYTKSNSSRADNSTDSVTAPNTTDGDGNSTESAQHTVDNNEATASLASTGKPIRRCGNGFYRDVLGRCRRIRRPIIPLLGLGYPPRTAKAFHPSLGTGALPRK